MKEAERPVLDFERPVVELERRIEELERLAAAGPPAGGELAGELTALRAEAARLLSEIYADLSDWQRTQLSRHPSRPYTLDYVEHLLEDFVELHGDRRFSDDEAIVAGLGRLDGVPVVLIGHQKGRGTKENVRRNFGMPRPEGYRKALRLMELAGRFSRPLVTLIDTPGAFPGVEAEERGQAEAIARNLEVMARLPVPIVAVVIGEGGSGGALAIGVADRVLMLEYATYSVISPEGCASILWRDATHAPEAARALRLSAPAVHALGVADEVLPEPPGGAHRDPAAAAAAVRAAVARHLAELRTLAVDDLLERRYQKLRRLGAYQEAAR